MPKEFVKEAFKIISRLEKKGFSDKEIGRIGNVLVGYGGTE